MESVQDMNLGCSAIAAIAAAAENPTIPCHSAVQLEFLCISTTRFMYTFSWGLSFLLNFIGRVIKILP